jgi:hypothetical protein
MGAVLFSGPLVVALVLPGAGLFLLGAAAIGFGIREVVK